MKQHTVEHSVSIIKHPISEESDRVRISMGHVTRDGFRVPSYRTHPESRKFSRNISFPGRDTRGPDFDQWGKSCMQRLYFKVNWTEVEIWSVETYLGYS